MWERDTLLLVDEKNEDRAAMRELFRESYNLLEASSAEQAQVLLAQNSDCIAAMLVSETFLTGESHALMDEIHARGLLSVLPVLALTVRKDAGAEFFEMGVADRLYRNADPSVLQQRVNNIVELYHQKELLQEQLSRQADEQRRNNEVVLDVLCGIIEYRHAEAGRHSVRMRRYTQMLLEDVAKTWPEYGLTPQDIEVMASATALHDIGKIAIPDEIVRKKEKLTPQEFAHMQEHPIIGCRILKDLQGVVQDDYLRYAYNICRYHHERWDGKGYPEGLRGEEIPICAQAAGLADAYDALTTQRIYKPAYPYGVAVNMILNGECGSFSPKLLECFKHLVGDFSVLARSFHREKSVREEALDLTLHPQDALLNGAATSQYAQIKYQALLNYLDATVVEVEARHGVYHLVYHPDSDLGVLKANTLEGGVHRLINESVHPDDREALRKMFQNGMQTFFEQGMRRWSKRVRIRSTALDGAYFWYETSILRLDMDDDYLRRALLIWRKTAEGPEGEEAAHRPARPVLDSALNSLFGCTYCVRNDRWFTLEGIYANGCMITGHTAEEMKEKYHDRAIELIPPEDREKVRQLVQKQLEQGRNLELELRLRHRDGHIVWALAKCKLACGRDGREYIYGVLMDVSAFKEAATELHLTLERHRIILEQTDDVVFEWDAATDTLECSGKWEELFGYRALSANFTKRVGIASHVHPEDVPVLLAGHKAISNGRGYQEMEVRIAKADGRYLWCRVRATPQLDADGHIIKAVGVVINIDKEKRDAEALQSQAAQDPLTKLLNKTSARSQSEQYFTASGGRASAALLVIDLDNFKRVNDQHGHLCGDTVLLRAAAEIKRLFRNGDVVARIGGDEFMVLMKDIPNAALAERRCQQILEGIARIEMPDQSTLSCSIGVALAPEHVQNYRDLFQKADQALYTVKRAGKSGFACYNDSHVAKLPVSATATRTRIDSEIGVVDSEWIRYTFHSLYAANDVESAINAVLEMIGRQMDVSRVYIFETDKQGAVFNNTFEWCNDGVPSVKHLMQGVDRATLLEGWEDCYDERGLLCITDRHAMTPAQAEMLRVQNIESMLHCAIRDNGVFSGFVGFDECKPGRLWHKEQVDALAYLSEMVGLFLFKMRAQRDLMAQVEDLNSVLDNQDEWIFVIDPESCEIKFLNEKMHDFAPLAKLGMHCYRAVMGNEARCPGCPANGIRKKENRKAVLSNEYLGVCMQATATGIFWQGKPACLITCRPAETPEQ